MLLGVQFGLPLVLKPSSMGVSPFPKCDLKMMRLKKLLVSFLKSFLLGFPGLGT